MSSYLRALLALPRKGHAEADLDLCYVTDNIIATSGPSHSYPQRVYRNPVDKLVGFLDRQHGANWAIWEFRAEGTGYPDALAHHRVRHYPFPDHHPPPFALLPLLLADMRRWLHGGDLGGGGAVTQERRKNRVVVVHCKAGKGRSGTASVSYLIAEEGWTAAAALAQFTERRMRAGFGEGVSIPSQRRWVDYVERWARSGKMYEDRPVEVMEIHAWGLRDGVRVDVEGFVEKGRRIHRYHTFTRDEREIVRGDAPTDTSMLHFIRGFTGYDAGTTNEDIIGLPAHINTPARAQTEPITGDSKQETAAPAPRAPGQRSQTSDSSGRNSASADEEEEPGGMEVIFRPASPIVIPHSDVNIAVELRHRLHSRLGYSLVSTVAHVWFNAFFEGRGPENGGVPDPAGGTFTIAWDAMDGIKGTSRKGSRGLDRISVKWRFADVAAKDAATVQADAEAGAPDDVREKDLGLRVQSPASVDVSRASSVRTAEVPRLVKGEEAAPAADAGAAVLESVKTSDPSGAELRLEETKDAA